MYNPDAPLVTADQISEAATVVYNSPHVVRTPMLHGVQAMFDMDKSIQLNFKLENMQTMGSFKVRGIINQLEKLPQGCGTDDHKLISMSAGNYGKSFAFLCQKYGLKSMVLMPETAPSNRADIIQGFGSTVERLPSSELQPGVDRYVQHQNMVYLHSFDDPVLIAGHASVGLEILEDVAEPDVVLVCCGGGGLLSGVAAAIKFGSKKHCRVYGVEPQGARTMHESFKLGRPASMTVRTIAAGLAPPFAGSNAYKHCKQFVDDILLVSDQEIVTAMLALYRRGLLVEPSGSAAFAAMLYNKVPDVQGKTVVVVITGGNVTPQELCEIQQGSSY